MIFSQSLTINERVALLLVSGFIRWSIVGSCVSWRWMWFSHFVPCSIDSTSWEADTREDWGGCASDETKRKRRRKQLERIYIIGSGVCVLQRNRDKCRILNRFSFGFPRWLVPFFPCSLLFPLELIRVWMWTGGCWEVKPINVILVGIMNTKTCQKCIIKNYNIHPPPMSIRKKQGIKEVN